MTLDAKTALYARFKGDLGGVTKPGSVNNRTFTPPYGSPEPLSVFLRMGEMNQSSDVWSCEAVLLEIYFRMTMEKENLRGENR